MTDPLAASWAALISAIATAILWAAAYYFGPGGGGRPRGGKHGRHERDDDA